MAQDLMHYDRMVEQALRGVVREALGLAARDGLRGGHHFYIGFHTGAAGVVLPPQLLAKFPEEMTIVLQHQFWGLEVGESAFSVTLSFASRMERLTIPFAAITSFADPAVEFGLQFQAPTGSSGAAPRAGLPAAAASSRAEERHTEKPAGAEIVTLDRFRKR